MGTHGVGGGGGGGEAGSDELEEDCGGGGGICAWHTAVISACVHETWSILISKTLINNDKVCEQTNSTFGQVKLLCFCEAFQQYIQIN